MSAPGDVPPEILDRLRPICRGLPDVIEEPAWIGLRWRIRRNTFAHVYTVEPDTDRAYTRGADEPICVMTFRAPAEELHALTGAGFPFFRAPWGTNVVVMVLSAETDWDEVGELLIESYRVQAPKRLASTVD